MMMMNSYSDPSSIESRPMQASGYLRYEYMGKPFEVDELTPQDKNDVLRYAFSAQPNPLTITVEV